MENRVVLKLTRAQALVLEDFISHIQGKALFEGLDVAEKLVVFTIHNQVEDVLEELQHPNYPTLIQKARKEVVEISL